MKALLEQYGGSVFKEGGKWRTSTADIVSLIEDIVDEGEGDYDGVIIKNVEDTGSYGKGLTTVNDYTPNPEVYEKEVTDADKLIDAKIENYKVELESKLERKEETHNYYNQEIAHKQSILDKKKNKTAKVARDLTDQIERLKRNRDNADAEADKQINALKERIDKMGTKEYRTAEQRKVKQASIRK